MNSSQAAVAANNVTKAEPPPPTRAMPSEAQGVKTLMVEIGPEHLHPNPHQPRSEFDAAKLSQLAEDIRHHGLLQPVVVTRRKEGGYFIIAGERRVRAYRMLQESAEGTAAKARWAKIPAVEKADVSNDEKLTMAWAENTQRANLTVGEELEQVVKLKEAPFSLDTKAIAERMGLPATRVRDLWTLSDAPVVIQKALRGLRVRELDAAGNEVVKGEGEGARLVKTQASLDVRAALELNRLYAFYKEVKPRRVDALIEDVTARVLEEGWTLKAIQDFRRTKEDASTKASPSTDGLAEGGRGSAARPPYRLTATELHVSLTRLGELTSQQKQEVKNALQQAIAQLA